MQECFPVEERCRQQRALIPGSARTAAIRGCVLSQNCSSSDKHRQEEHFRNNPSCLWCQSLLLIYPQSELLCVTSYTAAFRIISVLRFCQRRVCRGLYSAGWRFSCVRVCLNLFLLGHCIPPCVFFMLCMAASTPCSGVGAVCGGWSSLWGSVRTCKSEPSK